MAIGDRRRSSDTRVCGAATARDESYNFRAPLRNDQPMAVEDRLVYLEKKVNGAIGWVQRPHSSVRSPPRLLRQPGGREAVASRGAAGPPTILYSCRPDDRCACSVA